MIEATIVETMKNKYLPSVSWDTNMIILRAHKYKFKC